jgi:hypothetical protein
MTINKSCKDTLNIGHVACAFGLLLSLAALPAFGQQVHQLSYNNSYWADQNLNGVQAIPYPLAAFITTPNDQSHVYYLSYSTSAHVHQLFYNGVSWSDEDLTALSGGPVAYGNVTGFSVGNYQYVYYATPQGNVHQLLYNNSNWVDSDLTALAGSKSVVGLISGLVAFTTTPALHVYYTDDSGPRGGGGDIHQLFSNDGVTWQDQNLTVLAGLDPIEGGGYLQSGFNVGNLQYLHYVDYGNDLHQLSYNNSKWSDADLSVSAKGGAFSSVTSFVIPGTKKMRLYYRRNTNFHLYQLASSNGIKWASTDLTKKSKGPLPDVDTSLLAYATTPNDGVHVFYISGSHVEQLYQPTATTWVNEDLTSEGNGAYAASFSGLAGFSIQNEQFVFYQAQ